MQCRIMIASVKGRLCCRAAAVSGTAELRNLGLLIDATHAASAACESSLARPVLRTEVDDSARGWPETPVRPASASRPNSEMWAGLCVCERNVSRQQTMRRSVDVL